MCIYNKAEFHSFLIKGQLHAAMDYIRKFKDKKELHERYINTFDKGHYYQRTENKIINHIDQIFQNYYRNVFWKNLSKEDAKKILFYELWRFCGSKEELTKEEDIEAEIAKIVKAEGYEYLGGETQGFFGPYIWRSSTKVTYEVELPSGIELYTIIMMDEFISRSWLDYISFGSIGTGGWVGESGMLCCVKSSYENKDEDLFNISFLKHEAQHAYDKQKYSDITSVDMEYRAKLVELVYWKDHEKILNILKESDNSNPHNSHSFASYRIIKELSQKIFQCEYVKDEALWENKEEMVKKFALDLLEESNITLNLGTDPFQHILD